MHISPVVVAAAARHHVDRVKEETDGLRTRLEKLGRLAGVDSAEAVEDADTLSAEAMAGQEPPTGADRRGVAAARGASTTAAPRPGAARARPRADGAAP